MGMFKIDIFPNVTPCISRMSIPLNRCVQELNPNEDASLNKVHESCTDDDILQLAFVVESSIGLSKTKRRQFE